MAQGRYIAYYRVSTVSQGRSGLGLEAQRDAVMAYLNGGCWVLSAEFTEVESGKRVANRPQLGAALEACRLTGATLVIAKLDRLSRDAHFLIGLQAAGVDFIAVDMPNANRLTVGIMALVAQEEREAISTRTKAALGAAKARGVVLGGWKGGPKVDSAAGREAQRVRAEAFAQGLSGIVGPMVARGDSLRTIAAALTERGVMTVRGGTWSAAGVRDVIARLRSVSG